MFVGSELRSVHVGEGGVPLSFDWNGEALRVVRCIRQWQDFDYSPLAPRKDWKTRRHRNHFRIQTEDGRILDVYCDRGIHATSSRKWVLYQTVEDPGPLEIP